MKLKLTKLDTPIEQLNGKPYMTADNKPATLGSTLAEVLASGIDGEKPKPGEKYHRGALAILLYKSTEITIEQSERDLLKRCVESRCNEVIVKQLWDALDQAAPLDSEAS